MMDKVFIKDLMVQAVIGILEREREVPQNVLINVIVFTDSRPASAPDDIGICIDYSELATEIRTLTETRRRFTIEALADDIAQACLCKGGVKKVIVRVEKTTAVPGAVSAGVEIERP